MIDFRCPLCGFRVFNRKHARCEGCAAQLPPELLLSSEEIAARALAEERRAIERREKILAGSPGGEAVRYLGIFDGSWFF